MNTTISRALAASAATALLAISLAGCGSGDSAADPGTPSRSTGASDSGVGATFCTTIKSVQADLPADAPSAAFLAQVTIKLDPSTTAQLSAAVVDPATEARCPDEYHAFLRQAGIASLGELGLQP